MSMVDQFYQCDKDIVARKLDSYADRFRTDVRLTLAGIDMFKAYGVLCAFASYRGQVNALLTLLAEQLIQEITATRHSSSYDKIALKVFHGLIGHDSVAADRLAVVAAEALNALVVWYSRKPLDGRLVDAYRRSRIAWIVYEIEALSCNTFLSLANEYYKRFFSLFRPPSTRQHHALLKKEQDHCRLIREQKESDNLLASRFHGVTGAVQAYKWWTRAPHIQSLAQQEIVCAAYYSARLSHCSLNERENLVFDELINMATS
jgi:hypothetical protein